MQILRPFSYWRYRRFNVLTFWQFLLQRLETASIIVRVRRHTQALFIEINLRCELIRDRSDSVHTFQGNK